MTLSPTIRLFVSSTFSDLKAEPFDFAQDRLFDRAPAFVRTPAGKQGRLKQLCLSKVLRFQAIDLRRGGPV